MTAVDAIPSAFQSASASIQKSLQNINRDAQVVANSATVESRDTVAAMVDSRQQVLYVRASARLINASDAMTRALLDIHA